MKNDRPCDDNERTLSPMVAAKKSVKSTDSTCAGTSNVNVTFQNSARVNSERTMMHSRAAVPSLPASSP